MTTRHPETVPCGICGRPLPFGLAWRSGDPRTGEVQYYCAGCVETISASMDKAVRCEAASRRQRN